MERASEYGQKKNNSPETRIERDVTISLCFSHFYSLHKSLSKIREDYLDRGCNMNHQDVPPNISLICAVV